MPELTEVLFGVRITDSGGTKKACITWGPRSPQGRGNLESTLWPTVSIGMYPACGR